MSLYFLLLAVVESAVLFAAFCVGLYFYAGANFVSDGVGSLVIGATAFAGVAMAGLLAVGLYRSRQRVNFVETIMRVATALALTALANITLYYLLSAIAIPPKAQSYALLIAFGGLLLVRTAFYAYAGTERFKRNVLVYGNGDTAAALARLCAGPGQRSFSIIGFVGVLGEKAHLGCAPLLQRSDTLLQFARDRKVDEIVVALDNRRNALPTRELVDCRFRGVRVSEALTFAERETGKIDLGALRPSWFIYGDGFRQSALHRGLKRTFDVVASLAVLFLSLPLLALAALAIAIESRGRGAILFRQDRVGQYGEVFKMFKLRSMVPDAEKDGKARWASHGDPRVTRVGALIRRLRIDELPQIVNVLRGEMSFVGPRPERPEFVSSLAAQIPFYDERHCVKPGLTGWAQVSYPYGASVNDAREKLQYDLFYVKHHSPVFDFLILMQTLEIVIWGKARASSGNADAEPELVANPALASDSSSVSQEAAAPSDIAVSGARQRRIA